MQDNLDAYVKGDINANARRVLFTKWVGQAWEEVSADKEMIVRSFKKCGLEDEEIISRASMVTTWKTMTTRSSQMKRTPLLTVIAQRCNCTNNLLFNIIILPP